ncbi:MAG: Alkanesulfonates transport system permease protein [Firmicutes bacterium]|nr:Alkanesulfonates transport system permease protein [Bacillota bacterium]
MSASLEASTPSTGARKRPLRHLKGWALPVFILVVWQLLATLGNISPVLLPAPSRVLQAGWDLTLSGDLPLHLLMSLQRAGLGLIVGGIPALILGTWVGMSREAESWVDTTVQMNRTIPNLALAPLLILWFGIDELPKVLLVGAAVFFHIYVNTFHGIRGVDRKLVEVATVLRLGTWERLRVLVFPAALPSILLGLRLALGSAWLALIAAEILGAHRGIGSMIWDAREFSQTDIVLLGVVVYAVSGKLIDSLIRLIERRALRWRQTFEGV